MKLRSPSTLESMSWGTLGCFRRLWISSSMRMRSSRLVVENRARGTTTEVLYRDLLVNPEIDDRVFSIRTLEQKRPIPGAR